MIIIENIDNQIVLLEKLICKQVKTMYKKLDEKNVGIVDLDFSLIRYLCKEISLRDVNINRSGYPTIKRKDNKTTMLGRFILEYYSKYDEELKQILNNTEYEINHKNRNKLDNRLENLEIVTHSNNIKHSKGKSYEVFYSTEKLKLLQEQNIQDKQQIVDEQYLKRMSGLFHDFKMNIRDERMLKCCYCYLSFKYINSNKDNNTSKYIDINKNIDLRKYKLMKNFCTNKLLHLEQRKREFIFKTIINNNKNLLNRYNTRYPYIKEVLKKYKLVDNEFKDKLNFEHSNSKNLLYDLFEDIFNSNKYVIDNGDIVINVTLKNFFNVRGKYKSFLVLYLLGLLKRKKDYSKPNTSTRKYIHTPSFIKIPVYTDDLLKQTNELSKELLELNLNKFTYFLVRQEFGEDLADEIYKNNKSKSKYKYSVRSKEDIINFLKTDEELYKQGFITKEEIFEHIEFLNIQRAIKDEEHNFINKGFKNFITSLLLYNSDTKQVLKNLGLVYTTLNTKIIHNIKKHQKEHNFVFPFDLKPKMKLFVLKELLK